MSIDLHIHSKNSDGTDSIDEIVSKSKDQQLQAISITDHEYLSEVNAEGIEIISGVEMSVSWNDLDFTESIQWYTSFSLLFRKEYSS